MAQAVHRVANHGPIRAQCLVRSLAIARWLRAEGIEGARVRVGVALKGGQFVAHAWVEYAGQVVGDDDSVVSRFESVDDLNVVAGG
jgi:hypothetical protein